ncbi:MAG: type II toxin-antitoxin system RelE/ParE family toxin [Reichenbachiella sp.]|uniref:type II toxin-antitoxin system RelE/ParE family toxin n=1 Tax=Reichenbachiella sp. TaxID=2184521 RepID=UPI0029666F6E|nr:type II toxin-antitoxin system RelE/ParE family toxin [Reichenbachiella sp.]MDW3211212.1 type II toxin-antitoxin system RelE/ParE family toxin [Reichenbachiella sp.]
MIESFGCKHTEKVWNGVRTKKWSIEIANKALRKLIMISAAGDIQDMKIPPSNRLHKLKGNLSEYWAISINDQWRFIFKWVNSNAQDVQIIDYH